MCEKSCWGRAQPASCPPLSRQRSEGIVTGMVPLQALCVLLFARATSGSTTCDSAAAMQVRVAHPTLRGFLLAHPRSLSNGNAFVHLRFTKPVTLKHRWGPVRWEHFGMNTSMSGTSTLKFSLRKPQSVAALIDWGIVLQQPYCGPVHAYVTCTPNGEEALHPLPVRTHGPCAGLEHRQPTRNSTAPRGSKGQRSAPLAAASSRATGGPAPGPAMDLHVARHTARANSTSKIRHRRQKKNRARRQRAATTAPHSRCARNKCWSSRDGGGSTRKWRRPKQLRRRTPTKKRRQRTVIVDDDDDRLDDIHSAEHMETLEVDMD